MNALSLTPVRTLTLGEIGVDLEKRVGNSMLAAVSADADANELDPNDPILADALAALSMGYAGVILVGPPGTGKSWYAKRIANAIAGDMTAVQMVQFHTSYQYEDFIEGYVPATTGTGFKLEAKVLPQLCRIAKLNRSVTHVLVIDEISRCDVARVFGEALTYIERDKRELEFTLASGSTLSIPSNLVILATMNPWDKGVDELDVALERRFAQVEITPDPEVINRILLENSADPAFVDKLVVFFRAVQLLEEPACRLGHAYFLDCADEARASQVWRFRLRPYFQRACKFNSALFRQIEGMWASVVAPVGEKDASDTVLPSEGAPPEEAG